MSLNGLDNPAVLEAYQTALTEAGGWFLLQYVSRDEVALLNRGTGGVPDVQNAVDGYQDPSPLYGFLQYRRRKVILSYLPEGTSRLVKARATVQFQSVLDKFSPHDTVFSLSKSTDLTESALSSACLLHTASGSITSSSSSLRRRRLMEITEDVEENATTDKAAQSPASDTPYRPFSQRSDATVMAPPRMPSNLHRTTTASDQPAETSVPDSSSTSDQPPLPPSVAFDPSSERSASQKNLRDDVSLAPSESRRLSQSSRASLRDLDYPTAYTPKVKRAPRPSVDSNGRPRMAGNQRPVAALPAGVRSSALRRPSPNNLARPRSQGNPVASSMSGNGAPPVPPLSPLLVPPLSMPISRPQISPGAKSLSAMSTTGMSPEKERLMKALQQRKKQMEKRTGQNKQNQPAAERTEKNADENKENVGSGRLNHEDKVAADRTVNDNSEQSTKPPTANSQSILSTTEPRKEADPFFSAGQPEPDSAVDLVVSDSDGDQPSNTTSPPSTTPTTTATTLSIDQNNNNSNDLDDDDAAAAAAARKETEEEAQTPRTIPVPEPKSDARQTDSVDDSQSEDGPRSPSGVVDDPLENKSRKAPENEIVVSPPPTKQPPNLGGQEVEATAEAPETISQPDAPSIADSSSSTIVSNGPEPQHDSPSPEYSDAVRQDVTGRKDKRKPYLEPIQVPTPEYSDDDNLLSDDSFMEELKSATVQEAKPVSVGKSPLSPVYPNNGYDQASSPEVAWKNSRAVSNPSATIESQSTPNLHAVTEGRSVSSTYPDANDPMSPVLVARKVNVSSGISKRIKALEKFTGGREPPATSIPPNLAPAPSSSDTFRKRTSISKESPSISRNASYSGDLSPKSEGTNRDDSQTSVNGTQTTSSVSVTARIVRDSDGVSPDASLGLQASRLKVEHETSEVPQPQTQNLTPEPAIDEREKRSMSTSSTGSGNQPQAVAAAVPRSESRLSVSSQSRGDAAQSKFGGDSDERRTSRTSRLLHRVSSITSNSRRSLLGTLSPSPSFKEEDAVSVAEKEPEPAPEPEPETHQPVNVGEVNVQFPDTLLWKRRFVRVDEKGYLVLTPANVDSSGRNMTKRYHLTEFRTPCLPDEDRQELPNSILLDFLDGSTLQCACESRQGQAAVLETLVHIHSAHQPVS